ncbi:translation initiation factor [Candidatus Woesearchaeota archaeon]|nr:translation initiation factor [Candidatus Woesearchaeota archaeon]
MSETCSTCGLPKELCVCETIAKESQKIVVESVKKKFGKVSTIVSGMDETEINLKDLAKNLKSKFACGGTAKEGHIELQGDHCKEIRTELIKLGFSPDQIEIRQGKRR